MPDVTVTVIDNRGARRVVATASTGAYRIGGLAAGAWARIEVATPDSGRVDRRQRAAVRDDSDGGPGGSEAPRRSASAPPVPCRSGCSPTTTVTGCKTGRSAVSRLRPSRGRGHARPPAHGNDGRLGLVARRRPGPRPRHSRRRRSHRQQPSRPAMSRSCWSSGAPPPGPRRSGSSCCGCRSPSLATARRRAPGRRGRAVRAVWPGRAGQAGRAGSPAVSVTRPRPAISTPWSVPWSGWPAPAPAAGRGRRVGILEGRPERPGHGRPWWPGHRRAGQRPAGGRGGVGPHGLGTAP